VEESGSSEEENGLVSELHGWLVGDGYVKVNEQWLSGLMSEL